MVSLVLLAGSQPRIAAQRAVRAAVGRRVCGLRPDACGLVLCFPHERGARWCSAPRPVVWPSLGVASCVAAASVAYSLTGLSGRAFPTLRRDARTNGARWCSAPPPVMAEPGRRVVCRCCERSLVSNRVLRVGVAYSLTGLLRVSSSARIATSFGPSHRRRAVPVETCR